MRHLGALALVGALLTAVTACSGGKGTSAPTTPPPVTAAPSIAGGDAFLDNVHDPSSGAQGLAKATNAQLTALGTAACAALAGTSTLDQARQSLMGSTLHPSSSDAEAVLEAAVANLCPEHADKLPAPAASDANK